MSLVRSHFSSTFHLKYVIQLSINIVAGLSQLFAWIFVNELFQNKKEQFTSFILIVTLSEYYLDYKDLFTLREPT
jgi:hypothetical protein